MPRIHGLASRRADAMSTDSQDGASKQPEHEVVCESNPDRIVTADFHHVAQSHELREIQFQFPVRALRLAACEQDRDVSLLRQVRSQEIALGPKRAA